MQATKQDMILSQCLKDQVDALRLNIAQGRPYVWLLGISQADFEQLENALLLSVLSHQGSHEHLVSSEYALHLVIYVAEWYKRNYYGKETEENSAIQLTTEERIKLWQLSGIDSNIYVYNASENPGKPSRRWKESMQLLGGLAVMDELRRDKDNVFLSKLCRIYHGEELDLTELGDRGRAIAFQQSIVCHHSLYEYVKYILDGGCPFAKDDMVATCSPYSQFISHIKEADREARKDKFEMEWLISYAAYYHQMVRHLRIRLKPEATGGRYRQYIGYHRMREYWGIQNPESVNRLLFDLRFRNGKDMVREATFKSPILVFANTGSEETGFLSATNVDEIIYKHIPTEPFTSVEMVMLCNGRKQTIGSRLDCSQGYLQVYKVPETSSLWSSLHRPQAATAVIFDSRYQAKGISESSLVEVPFKDGDRQSEIMRWCPIYDQVTLQNEHGQDLSFYNRSGFYQVNIKRYDDTLKYSDKLYVYYRYTDIDGGEEEIEEEDYLEEEIPILFGRIGLTIRHYAKRNTDEWEPYTDYVLEYAKGKGFVAWDDSEPQQGCLHLRMTLANGQVIKTKVYYVPFTPKEDGEYPIWRDLHEEKIRFALPEMDDIADPMLKNDERQTETRKVAIGSPFAHADIEVYHPWHVTEVYQNGKLIEYHAPSDTISVPLISSGQFSFRKFDKEGVLEQSLAHNIAFEYDFTNINMEDAAKALFVQEIKVADFCKDFQIPSVRLYLTKIGVCDKWLCEWNYKEPSKDLIDSSSTLESGIIFQSLKDNECPRHYEMPKELDNDDGWGFSMDDEEDQMSDLDIYEEICKHHTYFFLFKPMRRVAGIRSMVKAILLPLLIKRSGMLSSEEKENLYRFAREFHFDWMLLDREFYIEAASSLAADESEAEKLKGWICDFFHDTPKCNEEREQKCLEEFLTEYWTFNKYSTEDKMVVKALKSILGDVDGLFTKKTSWEQFLHEYDACRYKFSEMSRVHSLTK